MWFFSWVQVSTSKKDATEYHPGNLSFHHAYIIGRSEITLFGKSIICLIRNIISPTLRVGVGVGGFCLIKDRRGRSKVILLRPNYIQIQEEIFWIGQIFQPLVLSIINYMNISQVNTLIENTSTRCIRAYNFSWIFNRYQKIFNWIYLAKFSICYLWTTLYLPYL